MYERGRRCGRTKVMVIIAVEEWRFVRGYLLRWAFWTAGEDWLFALIAANYVRRKGTSTYTPSRGVAALTMPPPVPGRAMGIIAVRSIEFSAGR